MNLTELHSLAIDESELIFRPIQDADWRLSTPDTDWDLRTLANHVASENLWVKPLLEGKSVDDIADEFDGDVLGPNPHAAFARAAEQARRSVGEAELSAIKVELSSGATPAADYLSQRILDLTIHGWDMAVSTNQDTTIHPLLVAAVTEIVKTQKEQLDQSGLFGSEIEVSDQANDQDRLLASLGRHTQN